MNNLTIEEFKKKDIFSLQKSFFNFGLLRAKEENKKIENLEIYEKEIIKIIQDPKYTIFVIKNLNEILGFIFTEIKRDFIPYFEKKEYLYINYLYIDEKIRGKGYSSKLFKKIKEYIKIKGIKEIRLNVSEKNILAQKVYKKWGFENYYKTLKFNI